VVPLPGAPDHDDADVIVLAAPAPRSTTRVVLDRQLNPFEAMTADERKRLIVRVLCGLVIYDSDAGQRPRQRLAG
jgi:hypothetical protein